MSESDRRTIVYLSGPMSNGGTLSRDEEHANVAEAIEVATTLAGVGYAPIVPQLTFFWQDTLAATSIGGFPWDTWLDIDDALVGAADCLLRLQGESKGADREVARAKQLGIPVFDSYTALRAKIPVRQTDTPSEPAPFPAKLLQQLNVAGETRAVDPDTGAEKGRKPERYDLIPGEALDDIARVYGSGATKYADHNWRRGYAWSWSFASLMRHAWAFWRGENNDPESGIPHMAHAAWHCLTLLTFMREQTAKDDRYTTRKGQA